MKCPKCGSKSYVVDTAQDSAANETYRRRMCEKCKHAFFTIEFEVERDKNFRETWNKYR